MGVCTNKLAPVAAFPAHWAPNGMVRYDQQRFPDRYQSGVFIAFHGSWNRSSRTGYKVVRVPMKDGVPTGEYQDFLTGFVVDDESVWGRPVGVAVAHDGALLVSDDASNTIWRVSAVK